MKIGGFWFLLGAKFLQAVSWAGAAKLLLGFELGISLEHYSWHVAVQALD